MFILVYFGYKQYRIFCINSLTASLMDYIWRFSKQDMEKLLGLREEIHNKEINTLQIKLKNSAQRLEELEVLIKKDEERKKRDEEEKQQLQVSSMHLLDPIIE